LLEREAQAITAGTAPDAVAPQEVAVAASGTA